CPSLSLCVCVLSCRSTLFFSFFFFSIIRPPPRPPLFPYTTLSRSLHSPIGTAASKTPWRVAETEAVQAPSRGPPLPPVCSMLFRSEEHTSELQSLTNLVCRLLLEKKKKKNKNQIHRIQHNHTRHIK